jgi:ATP-dependent RNA helicase SUPV3L1/SUV3
MNIEEIIFMYNSFKSIRKNILADYTKEEIYNLITCPVDTGNVELIELWQSYCKDYKNVTSFDLPKIDNQAELNDLETYYRKLDLYFQFSRKTQLSIKQEELSAAKKETVEKINKILSENSITFGRKCNRRGRQLPFDYEFGICQKCFTAQKRRNWKY